MPISDLLAQISGQGPSDAVPAKRKAQDVPKEGLVRKVPRTTTNANLPSRTATPLARLSAASSSSAKSSSIIQRPSLPSHRANPAAQAPESRPAPLARPQAARPTPAKPSPTSTNGDSRPSPSRLAPPASSASKPAPKKGGYAALMARAQKAQEMRGPGSIQNKPVEKPPVRREKDESRVDQMRKGRDESRIGKKPIGAAQRPGMAPKANASSASASRNGTGYKGKARGPQPPAKPASAAKKAAQPPPEPEKKVKKAALASTGYTGTARPKPNASTGVKSGDKPLGSPRRSGKPSRAPPRPEPYAAFRSRPKPRQEEEDDSEMDDFIVDDDDDDEGYSGRYQYASEEESDMEAGVDDVWMEEQEAERIARREDRREEEILRQRAAQKAKKLGR